MPILNFNRTRHFLALALALSAALHALTIYMVTTFGPARAVEGRTSTHLTINADLSPTTPPHKGSRHNSSDKKVEARTSNSAQPQSTQETSSGGRTGDSAVLSQYLSTLREQIRDRLPLPPSGLNKLKNTEVSEVLELELVVAQAGTVIERTITKPSASPRLNRWIQNQLENLENLAPIPTELGLQSIRIQVPLNFQVAAKTF